MTGNRKPIIGLTGGIGAGKSSVARCFADLGCAVIDADRLAREALEESAVRDALVARYGERVVGEGDGVDRRELSRLVFEKPEERAWLEELTHPRVRQRRRTLHARALADPDVRAIVEDSPLLMESGLDSSCDAVVFVDAPRSVRLERLARDRGWDEGELERREKNQMPLDTKRRSADYLVDNSGDEKHCCRAVRAVLTRILQDYCQDASR